MQCGGLPLGNPPSAAGQQPPKTRRDHEAYHDKRADNVRVAITPHGLLHGQRQNARPSQRHEDKENA